MNIIGVGDSVLDEYVDFDIMYPGGNSVNVPVLAKRCGAVQSAYIGILGNDYPGTCFRESLTNEGIDISRLRVVYGQTARNKVHIDGNGDRKFIGNNGCDVAQKMLTLTLNDNDITCIRAYDILHTSFHSEIDEILHKVVGKVRVSLDFSDAYDEQALSAYCGMVDFAFLSAGKYSEREAEHYAGYALECGAKTVVLTKGIRGSLILTRNQKHSEHAVPVEPKDTLGAGDAYIASFLRHFFDSSGNIELAAQQASKFASLSCLSSGAFGYPINLTKTMG
ncbi:PfkB family carbohydrate kinase [Sediminispirochaeta bajacaliforniensis]|uniref:PfkB family carbohydrate kinase n=1 Tax=Sediminispirochaeta bajacaliforniensis TaxID=148 RepID=UPI00036CD1A5|nr:PfkB family carbohydrate kinase [Sediminispirochaeta bajacaliforniensis]